MKKLRIGTIILVGLLIAASILGYAFAQENRAQLKKVTLAMTYVPNVQFAPWYVAQEKGFFKAEGINPVFDYRMDIDALPLAASGQMDFAIAGGDQVITARSQGIPVTYLASLYAKFTPTIISLTKSGINRPQDLRGKKIGLPLYGTNLLAVKAILNKAGIPESQVELVDVGYTQIPSLTSGKVDAVVGFANNEPLNLKSQGFSINEIRSSEYFPLVGHGLITGPNMIKTSPQLVRGMVRATIKGMNYSLDHPDEAFAICLKYLPELAKDQQGLQKKVLLASMELWQNDYTRQAGLGRSDPKAWEESQRLMLKAGLIKKSTSVAELLNQKFITK